MPSPAPAGSSGSGRGQPLRAGGAGLALALLAAGLGACTWGIVRARARERSVDDLTRRGFVAGDSKEAFQVIRGYDSPTAVRDYSVDNAVLTEVEPLAPLSEERMRAARVARMREHGWQKPKVVLVEGDPVPEGIDPRAVRFIPQRHPFALPQSQADEEWSEDVVRRRLRQRRGLPEKERELSQRRLARLRAEQAGLEGAAAAKAASKEAERTKRASGSDARAQGPGSHDPADLLSSEERGSARVGEQPSEDELARAELRRKGDSSRDRTNGRAT